jgi:O-antigen/teichoic acid export membrane protein
VAGLTIATSLTTPLGLITGPVVARALGPAGRGEVSTATVYSTLMWLVISLGLPIAIGQHSMRDRSQAAALLGTGVRYCLVVAPLVGALAYLLCVGPLDDFSAAAKAGIFVLMAVAPLNIVMNSA